MLGQLSRLAATGAVVELQQIADLLEKEGLNFGMKFEESTDGVRVADWGTPPSRAARRT